MFDNVYIIRLKNGTVRVGDGGSRAIHQGNRPVDHNFADRVQNKMIEMGYIPIEIQGSTTFTCSKNAS